MVKKQHGLFSGIVRLYDDMKNPCEDLLFESFSARDYPSAREALIRFGEKHLDDLGLNGGVRVMECYALDDGGKASSNNWVAKAQRAVKQLITTPTPATKAPAYVPYSCPIVSKCSKRYTGVVMEGSSHVNFELEENDQ